MAIGDTEDIIDSARGQISDATDSFDEGHTTLESVVGDLEEIDTENLRSEGVSHDLVSRLEDAIDAVRGAASTAYDASNEAQSAERELSDVQDEIVEALRFKDDGELSAALRDKLWREARVEAETILRKRIDDEQTAQTPQFPSGSVPGCFTATPAKREPKEGELDEIFRACLSNHVGMFIERILGVIPADAREEYVATLA